MAMASTVATAGRSAAGRGSDSAGRVDPSPPSPVAAAAPPVIPRTREGLKLTVIRPE